MMESSENQEKNAKPGIWDRILEIPADSPRWASLTYWLVLGLVVLRGLSHWLMPLDLAGDEAYYWEWGQHLDWGYFSKPPGIGWLMGGLSWLGVDSTFGIRMTSTLLGTIGLAFMYRLGRDLYDRRVGFITVLISAMTIGNLALTALLTIDAPLLMFWVVALAAFWNCVERGFRSLGWSILLILALAGGLLSKQTMLMFYPMSGLYLLLSAERRRLLWRPGYWIVVWVSWLALVPPLWWNRRNDWITFAHTAHHFEAAPPTVLARLQRLGELVGTQIGLLGPIMGLLLFALVFAGILKWWRWARSSQFLYAFGAPGILMVLVMTWRQEINPNWPAVFYPSLTVLLAAWALGDSSLLPMLQRLRAWVWPGVKLNVGLVIACYLVLGLLSFGVVSAINWDPSARLRGWTRLADDVQKIRNSTTEPGRELLITVGHRYVTSELAFYLPDRPRVYPFHAHYRQIVSQHHFWPDPGEHLGKDALIIVQRNRDKFPPELKACFRSVTEMESLHYEGLSRRHRDYDIFLGEELLSWPEPDLEAP